MMNIGQPQKKHVVLSLLLLFVFGGLALAIPKVVQAAQVYQTKTHLEQTQEQINKNSEKRQQYDEAKKQLEEENKQLREKAKQLQNKLTGEPIAFIKHRQVQKLS